MIQAEIFWTLMEIVHEACIGPYGFMGRDERQTYRGVTSCGS